MCKTAYAILVERSLKHALRQGKQLEVFFAEVGKQEDRDIVTYHRALKVEGMPFDNGRSAAYAGLTADEFRAGLLGDPERRTKKSLLLQIADLYLYPMVKAGYNRGSGPFRNLFDHGRVLDALIAEDERSHCEIKYSCFDTTQKGERLGG